MKPRDAERLRADTEAINLGFARIQQVGTRAALVLVVASFAAYLLGAAEPFVPPEKLLGIIGEGAAAFLAASGLPAGWGWLPLIAYGDIMSLAALMTLICVIIATYIYMVPVLLRQGDRVYLALVLLQLAVFFLAGSGWLGSGGH